MMKKNAEPAINNYFTIHVPASPLLHQNKQRKVKYPPQNINPFLNKKLQQIKPKEQKKIDCIYKSVSNKSIKFKKKTQTIPLLRNLKSNTLEKIGIIKESNKNFYNLIFTKKSLGSQLQEPPMRQTNGFTRQRQISTHVSRRNMRSTLTGHQNIRRSSSNMTDIRCSSPIKVDNYSWVNTNLTQSQQLTISGFKAPTSQTIDQLKKVILEDNNGFYRNIFPQN